MKQYCRGTLAQVEQTIRFEAPAIEELFCQRRRSVCVLALFALVEFAHDIHLPDEIHEESTMQDIRALGIDITLLHNDLVSYRKEELEGVPHNILAAYQGKGMTAQGAVDLIGGEIERRSLLL